MFRTHGLAPDELERVVGKFSLGADIGAEGFGLILAAAEAEAACRHFAGLTCGQIMLQDIVSAAPDILLGSLADLLRKHQCKALPDVDADQKRERIITQNDLIQRTCGISLPSEGGVASILHVLLDPACRKLSARDLMTTSLRIVRPEDGVGILGQLRADGGVQAAPAVEGERLVGIVTRSDLVAVLADQTVLPGAMSLTQEGQHHAGCRHLLPGLRSRGKGTSSATGRRWIPA